MILVPHVRSSTAAMCILVFAAAISVASAQQKQKTVDELTKQADVVAVGRVTALKSEWDEGKTRIITRVTLTVDEYLKEGTERSKTVNIVTLGGEIGDVGEMYTHVPTFRQSENVVVFLRKDNRGDYRVSGGTQGKYSIERDPESRKMMVGGSIPVEDFTTSIKRSINR
ncbi:MAG: hypothetical protein H6Q30_2705 [Bacteroidetes bacterium]|jgi:hypothetical protein|nr:hypothetical protein [Bacteroidota bacterium]